MSNPQASPRIGANSPGRREMLYLSGGALAGALLGSSGVLLTHRGSPPPQRDDAVRLTAAGARERLKAGNARYVAGRQQYPDQDLSRRRELAGGQRPFATVLSCADSRVGPEALFDQGIGDLFVVRTAGQVTDDVGLGSLQYGVEHLGVPLVLVLGHSQCGAVKATVEALEDGRHTGTALDSLVAGITPAVEEARKHGAEGDELLNAAVRINVERIVARLRKAPVIGAAASSHETEVLGAVYSLDSGGVDWL
jgi:carbonic anhydrase